MRDAHPHPDRLVQLDQTTLTQQAKHLVKVHPSRVRYGSTRHGHSTMAIC